jgi:serine protease Do
MENDPKPYKFMKESIKKQPPDWKKIVLLIAGWLALAALGGLVAAAVFAVTEPKIAEAVTREELPAKVRIQTADRSRIRQLPHLRRVRR